MLLEVECVAKGDTSQVIRPRMFKHVQDHFCPIA